MMSKLTPKPIYTFQQLRGEQSANHLKSQKVLLYENSKKSITSQISVAYLVENLSKWSTKNC